MKRIIFTLSLMLLMSGLHAQKMIGTWYGILNIQGSKLHVAFHIVQTGDTYSSTMDSPDQGASGLSTDKTIITGNQLTIEAAKFALKYTGTYQPDSNKIIGTFTQRGGSIPLILTTHQTSAALVEPAIRPQDPTSFPYKQEEVVFTNPKAGDQLAGTLTIPANGKVSKIVVFITGSGPQNRNEEISQFNQRPFLVWSDWLTRNGIAVLRYDDRGTGKSTGNFAPATSADFADDAEAAVNYIRSRADLTNLSIGLLGHSEGGMIAPMIASRNKAIKFVVLLAGPGVPAAQLMVQQNEDQMRLGGAPAAAITLASAINKKIYAALNEYKKLPVEELNVKIDTLMHQELLASSKNKLSRESIDAIIKRSKSQYDTPWFRYFITFNPADYLTKIKCPLLALNGTLDMQVQSTANLAAIKTDLQKAGNTRFEIVPLAGLNHLFQQATTGAVSEYSQISETVNPVVLQKVSGWINHL